MTSEKEMNKLLNGLIEKYNTPQEIEFEGLKFRSFSSAGEANEVAEQANKFANMVSKTTNKDFVEARTPYTTDSVNAYMIHFLSVEPKISELEALAIVKVPMLAGAILNKLSSSLIKEETEALESIEERKKG